MLPPSSFPMRRHGGYCLRSLDIGQAALIHGVKSMSHDCRHLSRRSLVVRTKQSALGSCRRMSDYLVRCEKAGRVETSG